MARRAVSSNQGQFLPELLSMTVFVFHLPSSSLRERQLKLPAFWLDVFAPEDEARVFRGLIDGGHEFAVVVPLMTESTSHQKTHHWDERAEKHTSDR